MARLSIRARVFTGAATSLLLTGGALAQTDPGPRAGAPAAGGPLPGLSADLAAYFTAAQPFFTERVSVSGTIAGSPGIGLGPRFNLDGCAGCHAFPSVGGSSPPNNPQFQVANAAGATNTIPSFLAANGPIRVARFVQNPDGTPDGSVHDLFTIAGRSDAKGCTLAQPNFAAALANHNVIFRIPTPTFGDGLVEAVPDANLIAAQAARATEQAQLGVNARFNHDSVDGTITRFGWKAAQKSLLAFAGEASLIEEGVTNDLRPNERDGAANCEFNATPEDRQPLTARNSVASGDSAYSSGIVNEAAFMRLTAPPSRGAITASVTAGAKLFASIGCDSCHIPDQVTGASPITGLQAVTFHPYSDFAIHNMGRGLVDGVTQGQAIGGDWRSAPLWGLGQRLFFLHDGRAHDLPTAIAAHASPGSEANQVIANYNALPPTQQQEVLNFLRSL